ncbi:SPO22-domain-containing protein [Athelia psychrophila]|uniref:SPO22-domain-containing protein n=1 Tax=Athelia psychrophila TaxID=1759441 RepID=A0A166VJK6_9AGAM|nr:SPO22-domain-containing protein [Fibularhizoctonia sp. CBS 109695]
MSSHKKGTVYPGVQETFDVIKDLLIKIKPGLSANKLDVGSILDDLSEVAALAEAFTAQRPRSKKNWVQFADALDREGVNLWNTSGLVSQGPDVNSRTIVATLRLAGFRLVEAGLEKTPRIETLLHVLQLASKCGAMLSEIESHDKASGVLTSAAKFEELLRDANDTEGSHQQAKARATVVYYSSRMEAAWREGNSSVASFMLQKITDNTQYLAHLAPSDRELLAAKLFEIGKGILKSASASTSGNADGRKAQDAVSWLQKSYSMVEQVDASITPGIGDLKRSILRSLSRAYFTSSAHDPENLSRAEVALQELIASVDDSADKASSEYQQLRWMRLAILKRRKAGDPELLPAFKSITDHMQLSETNITDVLQELRTMGAHHELVTDISMHCLQRSLDDADSASLERLLLSLIFHCSKDSDHVRATSDVTAAFNLLPEAEHELSKVSTAACITLLWQCGDRLYNAKKWKDAAEWFRIGNHPALKGMGHSTSSKCMRKAALCHIQQREYATAASDIRHCASNEAATHYVTLLVAVHQGLEDEAIKAARDMRQAANFDRNMLLLATQLAHESSMKALLLSVLDSLLQTVDVRESDTITEAMVLIRCSIRLILKLLVEPAANEPALCKTLVEHFSTANALVEQAVTVQKASLVIKDISWLWRTAYNTAVQGCSEWESSETLVTDLFQIAAELITVYCDAVLVDVDRDVYLHLINASFSAITGRVFSTRQAIAQEGSVGESRLRTLAAEIGICRKKILAITEKALRDDEDVARVRSYAHVLRVFETEIACRLGDWIALANIVAETDALAVETFEAIADILWEEKSCPVDVLFTTLEALLHASLDRNALAVDRFSRWLRAMCTILLSRNTLEDRAKALQYVEQASTVMESSSEDPSEDEAFYPMDERQWLLGTAYNTGIECLHASVLDEAKRWFETSTVICKYIPGGDKRSEQISETYTQLLSRYRG